MGKLLFEFIALIVVVTIHVFKAIARLFIPASRKPVDSEIVFISGAGSGLGRLLSLRFAKLGSTVVCLDINKQSNEETVNKIKSYGQKAFSFTCDCSSREDIYRVAEEIKASVGDVTILINNAGIVSGRKFLETPDELVEKTFQVNTLAHFWTVKAFLPGMLEKNHGHIVSIASSAALAGIAGLCDYCGSKFAAYGFNEALQMELDSMGREGVHTTVVCPYLINTGMFDGAKTRFPWLLPILDPEETVDEIMHAVLTNQRVLVVPRLLSLLLVIKRKKDGKRISSNNDVSKAPERWKIVSDVLSNTLFSYKNQFNENIEAEFSKKIGTK